MSMSMSMNGNVRDAAAAKDVPRVRVCSAQRTSVAGAVEVSLEITNSGHSDLEVRLSLSLKSISEIEGLVCLFLYTDGILFNVEWCIRYTALV